MVIELSLIQCSGRLTWFAACEPANRDDSCRMRQVLAILLEQNDEWAVQWARYMTRETMTEMLELPAIRLPPTAA